MLIKKMLKTFKFLLILNILITTNVLGDEKNFKNWLEDFKYEAIQSGISAEVVDDVMLNAKYLPKVIEYDRYQPEFYEDTFTYIKKRTSRGKLMTVSNCTKRKTNN